MAILHLFRSRKSARRERSPIHMADKGNVGADSDRFTYGPIRSGMSCFCAISIRLELMNREESVRTRREFRTICFHISPRLQSASWNLLVSSEMITIPRMERVRDYIHVVDLADGHVKALKKMEGEKGRRIDLQPGNRLRIQRSRRYSCL